MASVDAVIPIGSRHILHAEDVDFVRGDGSDQGSDVEHDQCYEQDINLGLNDDRHGDDVNEMIDEIKTKASGIVGATSQYVTNSAHKHSISTYVSSNNKRKSREVDTEQSNHRPNTTLGRRQLHKLGQNLPFTKEARTRTEGGSSVLSINSKKQTNDLISSSSQVDMRRSGQQHKSSQLTPNNRPIRRLGLRNQPVPHYDRLLKINGQTYEVSKTAEKSRLC